MISPSKQAQRMDSVPFSFHCTICFEQLNLTNKAPVILPCGHTYICEECAQSLDECVKCNRILTQWEVKKKPSTVQPQTNNTKGRRPRRQQQPPPPPPRLPIPKNHALMCLIEVTQKQHAIDRREDETDYDDFVLQGLQQRMGHTSGTYVVKEKNGLIVQPWKRKKSDNNTRDSTDGSDNSDNSIVNNGRRSSSVVIPQEGYRLQYGQTVQINMFEHGIAKVVKDTGFILASRYQLVKGKGNAAFLPPSLLVFFLMLILTNSL